MKNLIRIGILGVFTALVGCEENIAIIKLNKDGSGTILFRETKNTEAAAGMGGGMGMEEEGFEAPDPVAELKAEMEGYADSLGGVELGQGRPYTNKLGWKGYEQEFTFDDINEVTFALPSDEGEDGEPQGWQFTFTPGNEATLEVTSNFPQAEAGAAAEEADPEMAAQEAAQQEQMIKMMAPVLKGMRMTAMIKVDGEVVDTNGAFQTGKDQNIFLLMDVQVDKVLTNPELMKQSQAMQDGPPSETVDEDGLKFQYTDDESPLRITFR